MDKDVSKAVGGFLFAAFMFAAVILLLTYPIMWAMNYAFSPTFLAFVFGVSELTFWKTFIASWVIGALVKGTK